MNEEQKERNPKVRPKHNKPLRLS